VILAAAADQHYHIRPVSFDLQNGRVIIVKEHDEIARGGHFVCVFALEVSSQFDFVTGDCVQSVIHCVKIRIYFHPLGFLLKLAQLPLYNKSSLFPDFVK